MLQWHEIPLRWSRVRRAAALVVLTLGVCGCAGAPLVAAPPRVCTIDKPGPVPFISYSRAVSAIHDIHWVCGGGAVVYNAPSCWAVTGVSVDFQRVAFTFAHNNNAVFEIPLSQLQTEVSVHLGCNPYVAVGKDRIFTTTNDAARFYDAVLTQLPTRAAESEWEVDSVYRVIAHAYVALPVKPVPGEDVRKLWVQAKDAIKHKRFNEAVTLLFSAFNKVPWWPDASYELAYLQEEEGHPREAAQCMKHYLQLVPDAPNARALRDKMYVWEGRATSPARIAPMVTPYSQWLPHSLGTVLISGAQAPVVFEVNHVAGGGAAVGAVVPGSPAATAGVSPGDVIIGLDGHPVTSAHQLVAMERAAPVGMGIPIEFVDQGQRHTVNVTL